MKQLPILFIAVGCLALLSSCKYAAGIKEIHIDLHNNNKLRIQLDVITTNAAEVYAEYWPDSAGAAHKAISETSKEETNHSLVLCNILPDTKYSYRLFTQHNGTKTPSKTYQFTSEKLPPWLQDQFKAVCPLPELLPQNFNEGFLLLNKRETPGVSYIADTKGRLRWYNMVEGTGVKVTHFTKDKTVISILGNNDEPTSYGSSILEINLRGDTIFYLKKGQGDFNFTIHHEILKQNNTVVTMYVDKRVINLSSVGGSTKDTVTGDGIVVLDTKGKKLWQWNVFDAVDPLKDPQILKTKKDWMHANSLSYDKDGNYLMSFYNNGQIWKIDAKNGNVIWKFGKGGTFTMPADCNFSMAHAAHINPFGELMFFNNGIDKNQSEVYAVKLDEAAKTAATSLHIQLPPQVYNDRMGSAYMVNDSLVLVCCSKRHISILTNKKGVLLWSLDTAIPPYRVEFLKKEDVAPWLKD